MSMVFNHGETHWKGSHTWWLPANAGLITTGGLNPAEYQEVVIPDPDNNVTFPAYTFEASASEYVHFQMQIPSSMNPDLRLRWKPIMCPNGSDGIGSGDIRMQLGVYGWSRGDPGDQLNAGPGWAHEAITVAGPTVAWELIDRDQWGLNTHADVAVNDMIMLKVGRIATDAADTFSDDIHLIGLYVQYMLDAASDGGQRP
jgi:hypothetical protein